MFCYKIKSERQTSIHECKSHDPTNGNKTTSLRTFINCNWLQLNWKLSTRILALMKYASIQKSKSAWTSWQVMSLRSVSCLNQITHHLFKLIKISFVIYSMEIDLQGFSVAYLRENFIFFVYSFLFRYALIIMFPLQNTLATATQKISWIIYFLSIYTNILKESMYNIFYRLFLKL